MQANLQLHKRSLKEVVAPADWLPVRHALGEQPHLLHEAEIPPRQTHPGASPAASF